MSDFVTKTQAIKAFLSNETHADLAGLYNHNMEVQVTVAKDSGERVDGDYKGRQWHGYTDGVQTWKPIRIPLNAKSEPEFTDSPMAWDLAIHAEGIGMTGWNWKERKSLWVAFDFDAITGHSDKHSKKLTDTELENIRTCLSEIPYVTIRKSTGGKGLHVYVFLESITTQNHTEHAAVARAILSQLSGIAGFDFSIKVDTCGGNMWVWHRKMRNTQGLMILKQGNQLARVPDNWRDYTKVVSGRRIKNLPHFIEAQTNVKSDIEDLFAEITGQRIRTPLDPEHKCILKWLQDSYPNAVWWDAEHHMLVTHTVLLKECHEALNLRGKFETIALGEDKGHDINCFGFPLPRGAWTLRRYTLGVAEHAYWKQDGQGWTQTIFNREPTLEQAASLYNGLECPTGGFVFATAEEAQRAALLLGANLNLPTWALGSKTKIKLHKSGRLVVEMDKNPSAPALVDWLAEGKKLTRMFSIKASAPMEELDTIRLDDRIRHLVTTNGDDAGWVVKKGTEWHSEPFQNVKEVLRSFGYGQKEVSMILGANILQCWKLVSLPFQDEYPRDRQWNRCAAQLRYRPSISDNLKYPTWLSILNHLGFGLDLAVQTNEWCKTNNIITGADWLKCWIASLFQDSIEPLPYLFFYGEENSGKSIFHEALSLLMTKGVARADVALSSAFNGELEGAVLCVVEETDLKKSSGALNRIKDWVTSRMIPIHKKHKQPYEIPNTLHFVQCANSHLFCPVMPGDSRIVMIRVIGLAEDRKIPKKILIPRLQEEAHDFMAEILNLELPPSPDRLNIPCLMTEDKSIAEFSNQSMLELFIAEKLHYAPGHKMKFAEFHALFCEWLDPQFVAQWSKIRVGRELPPKYPKARIASGEFWIGNITDKYVTSADFGIPYSSIDGKLIQVENKK